MLTIIKSLIFQIEFSNKSSFFVIYPTTMNKINEIKNKFRQNKILHNSSVYISGNFIQKASEFLLLPLWTRYLTPSNYGIIGTITAYSGILLPILSMNLYSYISLAYYEKNQNKKAQKENISSIIVTQILLSSTILITFLLIGYFFGESLFSKQIPFFPFILLMLITTYFNAIINIPLNIYQAEQNSKKYVLTQYSIFFINFVSGFIFVVMQRKGVVGYLFAGLLSYAIIGVITIFFIFKNWFTTKINWNTVKASIEFGLPLVPRNITSYASRSIDRIIQERFISLDVIGNYSLGYKISSIIDNIVTSITLAWLPEYYRIISSGSFKNQKFRSYFSVYQFGLGVICVFLILFIREIIKTFLPSEYMNSTIFIPPIVLGLYINGLARFIASPLFYFRKTKIVLFNSIILASLSTILNILFIPKYGAIASAWLSVLVSLIGFLLNMFFSNKAQKIPLDYKSVITNLVFILVIIFLFQSIKLSVLATIILKFLFLALYLFINKNIIKYLKLTITKNE